MRYSVLVPFVPRRPEQLLQYASLIQWTQTERLWQGQSTLIDSFQQFATAAGAGFRVPVGIGVTLMPLRHPLDAALLARSLAITTGHPLVVGFGPGATIFQRSVMGRPYRSALSATREYVHIVRKLLDGVDPDFEGEYFTCRGPLPASPAPRIEVGIGVLRPGMARLAGEVADTAITWLTPASYLRDIVVPAMRAGAEAADRPMPRLVAMVPMAVKSSVNPVDVALASNGAHIRLPHYVDMLRQAGITISSSDARADAAALIDGQAFLYGDVEELVKQISQYGDAGVDEIVLNFTGICHLRGPQQALADTKAVLTEIFSNIRT